MVRTGVIVVSTIAMFGAVGNESKSTIESHSYQGGREELRAVSGVSVDVQSMYIELKKYYDENESNLINEVSIESVATYTVGSGNPMETGEIAEEVVSEQTDSGVTEVTKETEEVVEEVVEEKEPLTWSSVVDEEYVGQSYSLNDQERALVEQVVMTEAGGSDYIGESLVAQCIRDAILCYGYSDVYDVIEELDYACLYNYSPTDSVKEAVKYIFDEGGIAVKHRICVFYNPDKVNSSFHESQLYITTQGGHRYFAIR